MVHNTYLPNSKHHQVLSTATVERCFCCGQVLEHFACCRLSSRHNSFKHISWLAQGLLRSLSNTKTNDWIAFDCKTQSVRGNRWEVGVLYRGGNEINEQRLQKLLTPAQWKQITTTRVVVDQVLLEEAIKAGAITARTLAKCITPKKETPSLYIKELKWLYDQRRHCPS